MFCESTHDKKERVSGKSEILLKFVINLFFGKDEKSSKILFAKKLK